MKNSKNTSAKENKVEEQEQLNTNATPQDNIVQPNPNDEDKQAYIKENAKKGEPVFVPNVIGPNPISHKLADEK